MAGLLKNGSSDVRLAKVDAIEEKELANEFGVGGFPTLKFFKDGNRQNVTDFSGNVFIRLVCSYFHLIQCAEAYRHYYVI